SWKRRPSFFPGTGKGSLAGILLAARLPPWLFRQRQTLGVGDDLSKGRIEFLAGGSLEIVPDRGGVLARAFPEDRLGLIPFRPAHGRVVEVEADREDFHPVALHPAAEVFGVAARLRTLLHLRDLAVAYSGKGRVE